MTGRRCDVLCSARRREQLSPFDNGSPLSLPILVADAPRHRLVFLVDQGGGGGNWWGDLDRAQAARADVFPVMYAGPRRHVVLISRPRMNSNACCPATPTRR